MGGGYTLRECNHDEETRSPRTFLIKATAESTRPRCTIAFTARKYTCAIPHPSRLSWGRRSHTSTTIGRAQYGVAVSAYV